MTKKHFIALADVIKDAERHAAFSLDQKHILASFCAEQNSQFNRVRWLGYIAGTNGLSGGKVKPLVGR